MANWTQSQVNAHNAKLSVGNSNDAPKVTDCDDESKLHQEILDECGKRGWVALHGSMAHRAMRVSGEWDFVIVADHGRTFLCECKTAKGKLTPEQLGMKAWAEKLGHKPMVVRSFEDFITQLKQTGLEAI